jgi:hypothetical protein
MMKKRKWGVRWGRQSQGDGLGYPGAGGWETVVEYQIVGDGDGSKGIAIKSKNEDREAGVATQLVEGEGVKRKVGNVYGCKTMGQ